MLRDVNSFWDPILIEIDCCSVKEYKIPEMSACHRLGGMELSMVVLLLVPLPTHLTELVPFEFS
jgi:hypothetical protein